MKKYVIERNIPGVEMMDRAALRGAAQTSNKALAELGEKIQWVESYVTKDKTFCVYLAEDEAVIQEHARISGFPATRVTEISGIIDPATAG